MEILAFPTVYDLVDKTSPHLSAENLISDDETRRRVNRAGVALVCRNHDSAAAGEAGGDWESGGLNSLCY